LPEKKPEGRNQLEKLIELEKSLQSISQRIAPFCERLPVVRQAYEHRLRVGDDKCAWVEEAYTSLQALADIGLETARQLLTKPQPSEATLRGALEEAVDEFYKPWKELFQEVRETIGRASEELPTSRARAVSSWVHEKAIESTYRAIEDALKAVREFREAIEEEQARETPAGRCKRLDEFCEKHRCTYEDVCTSADVSRSSLYAWLNGKAPMVGARIELLLDGEIPFQKSGNS